MSLASEVGSTNTGVTRAKLFNESFSPRTRAACIGCRDPAQNRKNALFCFCLFPGIHPRLLCTYFARHTQGILTPTTCPVRTRGENKRARKQWLAFYVGGVPVYICRSWLFIAIRCLSKCKSRSFFYLVSPLGIPLFCKHPFGRSYTIVDIFLRSKPRSRSSSVSSIIVIDVAFLTVRI